MMIEGAKWKRWLYFYLPMGMFLLGLLFPFYWMLVTTVRPDGELYRPWNHPLYMPFWTTQPTLDHIKNLLQETLYIVFPIAVPGILSAGIFASRCRGTSSSTRWCSSPPPSRRRCRSAWS